MYELRNSLTHQYVADLKDTEVRYVAIDNSWGVNQAVTRNGDQFTVNVAKLIVDLITAWGKLRQKLEYDVKTD